MSVLLPYGRDRLEVTDAVLIAAVRNVFLSSKDMLEALFSMRPNDSIKEAVLITAAINRRHGELNIRMLVHLQQSTKVQVTEVVMLPMVKDAEQALEIFKVLFHECNNLVALPNGGITAVILEAAAGSLKTTAPSCYKSCLDVVDILSLSPNQSSLQQQRTLIGCIRC
jgi:hypothetical protein